ncbi:oxidoreductase [Leeia sp.]|uniref:oxidoreductase n=1 Tax=Leeia sp. TaxID=2884678 RepID=UPI0035B03AD4
MTAPLRVGLIGYGYAGQTFHAPLLGSTDGMVLNRICSSKPELVQRDWPGCMVDAYPMQTLQHPEVDLVVIATPNDSHAPLAAAALRAGKHVVVDKPFTLTVTEAEALLALAEQQQRVLSVFHNRRWDADFLTLQQLLADGVLGQVCHVESRFDRFRPQVRERWRERAELGGGLWYDLGPHLLDQAVCLFGLPQRLQAQLHTVRPGGSRDDWAHVLLDYGSLQVELRASMLVGGGLPRFAVHGTQGSWIKHGLDVQEQQLQQGIRPGHADWGLDPVPGLLLPERDHAQPASPRGNYPAYYAGIRDCITQGQPNPVSATSALHVMRLLERAQQSAAEGRSLPVSA